MFEFYLAIYDQGVILLGSFYSPDANNYYNFAIYKYVSSSINTYVLQRWAELLILF